jgi:hypothetical protein
MTATPYAISGHVYDTDGTTAIQGAVVSAKNVNNNEFLPNTAHDVTNSAGEYTIDCANFPSGYTDGDVIELHVFSPVSKRFHVYETVINAVNGSESKNITTEAFTYTTPAKVQALLGGFKISMDNTPTFADLARMIVEAEEDINRNTMHSWKEATVTEEYHTFGMYQHNNGRPIHLNHRSVKVFDSSKGDKIEIWTGSSYEEWASTKTEGRGADYWLESSLGVLWIRQIYLYIDSRDKVRVTYRYGEATVPGDISKAATMLAAIKLLTGEDRSVLLPEGETTNLNYGQKISEWQKQVDNVISSRAEMVVIGE